MKIVEYFRERRRIKTIKKQYSCLIRELKLFNTLEEYPCELQLKFINYGFELSFNISGICDYSKIENNLNFICDTFGAVHVGAVNTRGGVTLRVYTEELIDLNYKKYILPATTLLLGHNYEGFITVDMLKVPHLLVTGLSGQGKSRMINYTLNNLIGADVVVLNGYEEDYKGFKLVNGSKEIEEYLNSVLANTRKREKPLFLVLEEMQGLSGNKKIGELCKELLSYGRHRNIMCIGIIQVATKENCRWKDLYNCRLSFKQCDNSAFQVCLGISVEKDLQQREFYLYADKGLIKGKTFNLDF